MLRTILLSTILTILAPILFAGAGVVWPTESKAFDKGEGFENFIQATAANEPPSGLFGDVRSGGYKFHEGIDVKSVRRDRKGEALDDVYAAMDGRVACVNKIAGNSSYGRYVAIVHSERDVPVYTLYAHLREFDDAIKLGAEVKAGQRLGMMGRSASYRISKDCAHMHFEIGLMYSSNFNSWYARKKLKEKNRYGNYNGMNLVGMDPLAFFNAAKSGKLNKGFANYIKSLKVAYVIRFYTKKTPSFVKLYPALVDNEGSKSGWDIYFTWYGMPTKFERIKDPRASALEGEFEIIKYDSNEILRKCRRAVTLDSKGNLKKTALLIDILQKIF